MLARREIDIAAPLDTVRDVHADVNGWTSWRPDSSFDWSSYGFAVRSTIYDIDPRSRILWGGTAGGITGRAGRRPRDAVDA